MLYMKDFNNDNDLFLCQARKFLLPLGENSKKQFLYDTVPRRW